ncbi:MAG TPA: aminodeoxychorismate/anthranilate synthase component II [Firmicutes bacterium]|nr:aminodeoxychorismate/anthranilate synthase component II [Bacillota bacterium]
MILVIDNYDSFTYNLVQYLGELAGGMELRVIRNDKIDPEEVGRLDPQRIVLSPGPGNPDGAGACLEIVRRLEGRIPLLGVCLGHQVIGQAYGGEIIRAGNLMHGKVSAINHDSKGIFRGLKNCFKAARYHSLVVNSARLPPALAVTATSEDGEIMGLKHRRYPVWGIQFHPESIMTENGKKIIKNFLEEEQEQCR